MDNQDFYIEDYFIYQRRILKIVGLSLKSEENLFYRIYVVVVRLFILLYFLALLSDIAETADDIDEFINSIYHELGIILVLCTVFITSKNSKKLEETLNALQKGIFAPNRARGGYMEEIWIKECVKTSNRQILVSCTLAIAGILTAVINCIIKRILYKDHWELPFGEFAAFPTDRSPNFEIVWFFQSVTFIVSAVSYLSCVFLVVAVFSHICVQFKILRNSISKMLTINYIPEEVIESTDNLEQTALSKLSKEMLKTCWGYLLYRLQAHVRYHNAIIDLANQFEEILNGFILINYLVIMVALGCIMYHASLYTIWDPRFQKDLMIGLAWGFQLFLISYWGNQVILESEMLVNACYEVDFVGTDTRFQKGLCVLMTRGQKTIQFTVGKFRILSLAGFVSVLRASVSYYMVLNSRYTAK